MRIAGIGIPEPLKGAVAACRRHFWVAAGFSALINILYLAPAVYMMQVYDRVVPTSGIATLLWITAVVAFAIATLAALEAVRSRLMARASLRLDRMLSGDILDRLLARTRLKAGDATTSQAMREFDAIRQTLGGPATTALFDAPWTPIYVLVAFLVHPVLGCLVLASGTALAAVAFANQRSTRQQTEEAHKAVATAYMSQEAIAARSEVVRALGMRRVLIARQLRERHVGLSTGMQAQFAGGRYAAVAKFLRLFLQSFALGVAAWLAVERQISVGAIIAASVLLARALQPIELLVQNWPQILQARQGLATLTTLFESTSAGSRARTPLPVPSGVLDLERVAVRAPDNEGLIVKGVSLHVSPGEMLGIVGPSGAGKTTLARIIAGGLVPDAGLIRIDGADYQDWDHERLACHIGYLPQEPCLLAGTIAENISRFAQAGGEDHDEVASAVIAAAIAAGAHDMILRLPGGYDARLDHAGRGLSAGQAQRVALARALYRNPAVLVLDEPNSALDMEGEIALTSAIGMARDRGAAVIIVAHRLGILSGADRLAVMFDGIIDRVGSRAEILAELHGRKPAPAEMKEA